MLYRILSLQNITFKEGIKDKSILAIFFIAILAFIAIIIFPNLFARDIGKVCIDVALSSITLLGLILIFFTCSSILSKDVDKKTIYIVLARPFSRAEYIIGKYLGFLSLEVFVITIISVLSTVGVFICYHYNIYYFPKHFSFYEYLLAILMIVEMLAILIALLLFFSSLTTQGFTATILTLASYIIGSSLNDVLDTISNSSDSIKINKGIIYVINLVKYVFPNLSLFDFKLEVAHGVKISSQNITTAFLYGIIYILLLISLSCLLYKRKEFP